MKLPDGKLRFLEKRKLAVPRMMGDRQYRSQLFVNIGNIPVILLIEHAAERKPEQWRGKDRDTEKHPNVVADAKRRYPKSGAHAIVKCVCAYINAAPTPIFIGHFALKCFYLDVSVNHRWVIAHREANAWRMGGHQVWPFRELNNIEFAPRNKVYLLMPWIEGADLQQFFSSCSSGIDSDFTLRWMIAKQIWSYLCWLGQRRLVFSDLKPENIIFNPASKKITFVDTDFIDDNSRPESVTLYFLDKEKRQMAREHPFDLRYNWHDQVYAFGILVRTIFCRAVTPTHPHINMMQLFGNALLHLLCNSNKADRPTPLHRFSLFFSCDPSSVQRIYVDSNTTYHRPYTNEPLTQRILLICDRGRDEELRSRRL